MIVETSKELKFNFEGEDTGYLTHSFHPYPAKFPPQIPRKILESFARIGDTILDPFCGSGTTLVEARLFGANCIGIDVNGLSTLLSKVKATPLNNKQIISIENFISSIDEEIFKWRLGNRPEVKAKEIVGLKHWFQKNVAEEITHILELITLTDEVDVQDFLKIVLSSIIVRVSNQESDTRFAAVEKNIQDFFTLEQFSRKAKEYVIRIIEFSRKLNHKTDLKIFNADSRNLDFLMSDSIDLIITSPPYANTYDYYLYHKFRKRWLDLDVKFAQYNEIGSRREYSSLKEKPQKWINDLLLCFKEMHRVLKKQNLAFIVIGDSVINKKLIKIDEIIHNIALKVGFKVNEVISTDLSNHSKFFNPMYSQKGKYEHLIMLEKL